MSDSKHETHEADWNKVDVDPERPTQGPQIYKVTVPIDGKPSHDWRKEFGSAVRFLTPVMQGADVLDLKLSGTKISARATDAQVESGGIRNFINQAVEAANQGIVKTFEVHAQSAQTSTEKEDELKKRAADLQARLRHPRSD